MNDRRLPPELNRLEQDVARRPSPTISSELRDRVMRSVEDELVPVRPEQNGTANIRPAGWWTFAVAMAATVLVWLNLSLSVARATSYGLHLAAQPDAVEEAAEQIRDLVPEMSPRDARRYAAVLHAGSNLIGAPDVTAGPREPRGPSSLADLLSEGD